MAATCSSCAAPLLWVVTQEGKRMPLDAKPERRWLVEPGPGSGAPTGRMVEVHQTHWATCKSPEQHRRK